MNKIPYTFAYFDHPLTHPPKAVDNAGTGTISELNGDTAHAIHIVVVHDSDVFTETNIFDRCNRKQRHNFHKIDDKYSGRINVDLYIRRPAKLRNIYG